MCLLQIVRDNLMRSCHLVLLECQSSYEIASNDTHFLKNPLKSHSNMMLLSYSLWHWYFAFDVNFSVENFCRIWFWMWTEISSKQTFSPRKFYKSIQLWHMQILNLSKRTLSPKAGMNWVHIFFSDFCIFSDFVSSKLIVDLVFLYSLNTNPS